MNKDLYCCFTRYVHPIFETVAKLTRFVEVRVAKDGFGAVAS
jgi:hypothetical protein